MKRKEPVITQDEISAAIEEARGDFLTKAEDRPAGALSMEEWAVELGIGVTTLRAKMKKKLADKEYEKIIIIAQDSRGQPYKLPVYRKVKVPNAKSVDRIR